LLSSITDENDFILKVVRWLKLSKSY
jgi:hypothetical protein